MFNFINESSTNQRGKDADAGPEKCDAGMLLDAPEGMETDASAEREEVETSYLYPPLSLLQKQPPTDEEKVEEELAYTADLLVRTLESFGVQIRMLDIRRGPSVTRYELQPLEGVKISKITNRADDIALRLRAMAGVRIEALTPGKAAVGIEVPNRYSTPVSIRSILESAAYTDCTSPLRFALGVDTAGAARVADLRKLPNLLIAGSSGSGKSTCINTILMSFLYQCSPEDLRIILIDCTMPESSPYAGIPHMLMPLVTEPRKAVGALGAAMAETERRFCLFADNNVWNFESFNRFAEERDELEKMPYIVIVIDELDNLMTIAGKEVEDFICRLAQKGPRVGIHLIVATQRFSMDVITGLIKANIPSRITFSVRSQIDSRIILDGTDAEKLLGMGDMLFWPVGANKPIRIQGAFVHDDEINGVVSFIRQHSASDYSESMISEMDKCATAEKGADAADDDSGDSHDPMLNTAVETVIEAGIASTSLLQRRCKLGYARAAQIIDEMEKLHIIGPYEDTKPHQVLITRQQWLEMRRNILPEET